MSDQPGVRIRGRRTVPRVIGDGPARRMTALTMIVWGYASPRFWGSGNDGPGGGWVSRWLVSLP